MEKVLELRNKGFHIHYVAGNHDHHLQHLKGYSYPLDFVPYEVIEDPPHTYLFHHGHDSMTSRTSTSWRSCAGSCPMSWGGSGARCGAGSFPSLSLEHMGDPGSGKQEDQGHQGDTGVQVQQGAVAGVGDLTYDGVRGDRNTILVFGHTHRPFLIDNEHTDLVNSGPWVMDSLES